MTTPSGIAIQAQEHAEEAMAELIKLGMESKSDNVKVAAIKELLNRAFGRSAAGSFSDEATDVENMRGFKRELDAKLDRIVAGRRD